MLQTDLIGLLIKPCVSSSLTTYLTAFYFQPILEQAQAYAASVLSWLKAVGLSSLWLRFRELSLVLAQAWVFQRGLRAWKLFSTNWYGSRGVVISGIWRREEVASRFTRSELSSVHYYNREYMIYDIVGGAIFSTHL